MELTQHQADAFARMPLTYLRQEYPNHIMHLLNDDGDVLPPRELHPIFYGCFDWHSAVHGYWLLLRCVRLYPELPCRDAIVALFDEHLTAAWPLLQVTAQHDRRYAKQQHDNKRRDRRLCDADAAEQRDGKVDFRTIHGVESPSFVFCAAWGSGRKKSMSLMQICAKSSGRMAASGSHSSARNSRI